MALGVFFDKEGAFDNVQTSKVLEGIRAKGVPYNIIDWYGHYLSSCYDEISMGETTGCRSLPRGTPQGRILSLLVWNIAFDSLLDGLDGMPVIKFLGYADDGMLLILGRSLDILVDLAQSAINWAGQWGRDNGLVFSLKKIQVILFHRKNKLKVESNLHING